MTTALAAALLLALPQTAHAEVGAFTGGQCNFGNQWIVSGNGDGDGKDTVGIARAFEGARQWQLRNSLSAGGPDFTFTY